MKMKNNKNQIIKHKKKLKELKIRLKNLDNKGFKPLDKIHLQIISLENKLKKTLIIDKFLNKKIISLYFVIFILFIYMVFGGMISNIFIEEKEQNIKISGVNPQKFSIPTVNIISPIDGVILSGQAMINGTAFDKEDIIQRVEIQIDKGSWDLAIGNTTWFYIWDTNFVINGNYTIFVRSYNGSIYSDIIKLSVQVFNPNSWIVDDEGDGDFMSIQDAIDNPDVETGDTIFVFGGTYFENVVIDKQLNFIGKDKEYEFGSDTGKPIIDGNAQDNVVLIKADNVKISGFIIQNSGTQYGTQYDELIMCNGIKLESNQNNIFNNIFQNNLEGLGIYSSNNNTISNNIFNINIDNGLGIDNSYYNRIYDNTFIYDGILVWEAYQNYIFNNTINGKPLIYLENKTNICIDGNAGQIILVNCDNITVRNNELSNTFMGIELWNTNNSFIFNNTINNPEEWYCIQMLYSNYNIFKDNEISNADIGLFFRRENKNNLVINNNFSDCNLEGIRLEKNNNDNLVYKNNFISNKVNAFDFGENNSWDSGSIGNFWSNHFYKKDWNNDGISDIPYYVPILNFDRFPLMRIE